MVAARPPGRAVRLQQRIHYTVAPFGLQTFRKKVYIIVTNNNWMPPAMKKQPWRAACVFGEGKYSSPKGYLTYFFACGKNTSCIAS